MSRDIYRLGCARSEASWMSANAGRGWSHVRGGPCQRCGEPWDDPWCARINNTLLNRCVEVPSLKKSTKLQCEYHVQPLHEVYDTPRIPEGGEASSYPRIQSNSIKFYLVAHHLSKFPHAGTTHPASH